MQFSDEHLISIPHIISEPRFATYLRYCKNDRRDALTLYQWNLELSSAFVVPLHFLEVSIRNTVVEALEDVHTANWPWTQGFLISLPDPKSGYSPRKNLQKIAQKQPTMGKVVAELSFVFWERMFTKRHDSRLWSGRINSLLGNAPSELSVKQIRATVHDDLRAIRNLRNRIAHHEPIFSRNSTADYETIYRLMLWRSEVTAEWMNDIQRVTKLISERPIDYGNQT